MWVHGRRIKLHHEENKEPFKNYKNYNTADLYFTIICIIRTMYCHKDNNVEWTH